MNFPDVLTINVTQRDINRAEQSYEDGKDEHCAIESSLRRTFKNVDVHVGQSFIWFGSDGRNPLAEYKLPNSAKRLIDAFDNNRTPRPLKFKVTKNANQQTKQVFAP